MLKANYAITISLILIMGFFVGCSTPTVSSDDADEISEKVEQGDNSSSSDMSNSKEADRSSSSEKKTESSSSVKKSESSSSASYVNCSALLAVETEWSWNMPKECRFNPDIEYGSMTDSRDGQVYRTAKIGKQTWMAENLNYADSAKTSSLPGKSWCYDDDPKKCAVTGRLYTWAAAIDFAKLYKDKSIDCGDDKKCTLPAKVQGICPKDWHLPDSTEWKTLFMTVGGKSMAGKFLKSQTRWNKGRTGDFDSKNGTDAYGFSALPAGGREYSSDVDYYFEYVGYNTNFWSSAQYGPTGAYSMYLSYGVDSAELGYHPRGWGSSVRCVKD